MAPVMPPVIDRNWPISWSGVEIAKLFG